MILGCKVHMISINGCPKAFSNILESFKSYQHDNKIRYVHADGDIFAQSVENLLKIMSFRWLLGNFIDILRNAFYHIYDDLWL